MPVQSHAETLVSGRTKLVGGALALAMLYRASLSSQASRIAERLQRKRIINPARRRALQKDAEALKRRQNIMKWVSRVGVLLGGLSLYGDLKKGHATERAQMQVAHQAELAQVWQRLDKTTYERDAMQVNSDNFSRRAEQARIRFEHEITTLRKRIGEGEADLRDVKRELEKATNDLERAQRYLEHEKWKKDCANEEKAGLQKRIDELHQDIDSLFRSEDGVVTLRGAWNRDMAIDVVSRVVAQEDEVRKNLKEVVAKAVHDAGEYVSLYAVKLEAMLCKRDMVLSEVLKRMKGARIRDMMVIRDDRLPWLESRPHGKEVIKLVGGRYTCYSQRMTSNFKLNVRNVMEGREHSEDNVSKFVQCVLLVHGAEAMGFYEYDPSKNYAKILSELTKCNDLGYDPSYSDSPEDDDWATAGAPAAVGDASIPGGEPSGSGAGAGEES